MTHDTSTVLAQLEEVFQRVFHDDDIKLTPATTANDIDGWDSLAHINLIIAVEKHFKIRFATAEISGLKDEGQNVGTFSELIAKKQSGSK